MCPEVGFEMGGLGVGLGASDVRTGVRRQSFATPGPSAAAALATLGHGTLLVHQLIGWLNRLNLGTRRSVAGQQEIRQIRRRRRRNDPQTGLNGRRWRRHCSRLDGYGAQVHGTERGPVGWLAEFLFRTGRR